MGNNAIAKVPISVKGTQDFNGHTIPIVEGGFGSDAKCISDKTVAEIHGIPTYKIRERLSNNRIHFEPGTDYLDLKIVILQEDNNLNLLSELGYTAMEIGKAKHIYVFSERGYLKLVKIFDTDKAWDIYQELLDEYFRMRSEVKQLTPPEDYISAVRALLESLEEQKRLAEKNETLEADNAAMRPKAVFADTVQQSKDIIKIREMAKLLSDNGVKIGQNRLFKLLREEEVLMADNTPYQRYIDQGIFTLKETTYKTPDGTMHISTITMVTPRGQIWLANHVPQWLTACKES